MVIKRQAQFLRTFIILLVFLFSTLMLGCQSTGYLGSENTSTNENTAVVYGQAYSGKTEVANYLHIYSELPPNYITKEEAMSMGWISREGNLWDVAYGMSIGGDRFGNREGLLPIEKGRQYFECDINYRGGYRGAERIVYSNDGLIFYTEDHYKTFKQLY